MIATTIRKIVNELKIKPCMDCNGSFNPWQMDFDHRPGTKKLFEINKFVNVSSITPQRLNFLYEEIAKCDLVCANCHRDRTHKRSEHNA